MKLLRTVLLALTCATGCLTADKAATESRAAKPRPYVLTMCLVSDEKLDPGDPSLVYRGREIRVCCDRDPRFLQHAG